MAKTAFLRLGIDFLEDASRFATELGLAYDESAKHRGEVANGASNSSISMGLVTTASILVFTSDQTCTIRLTMTSTSTVETIDVTADGVVLLFNTSFTAMDISQSSGSTANIEAFIAGT